jgi:hypothetical protein
MNADQLKKDVGRRLRLRPHPQRVEGYRSMVITLSSAGPTYGRA